MPDPKPNPRILIVRVGAMGDVLHGLPAVAALRAAWPQAHIAWAVEPRWAPLLAASVAATPRSDAMPLLDALHHVPAKAWSRAPFSMRTFKSIAALRRSLRAERFDLAIDLQGTLRSAVIATMSGAPRVLGAAAPRERAARLFYTERVTLTGRHVVQHATEIVSHATGTPLAPAAARLPVDPAAELWCDSMLHSYAKPHVLVAPTAGWGAKQWPAERFGQLSAALAARGFRVLVNAAPAGTDHVAEAVLAASGNTATAVPCTLPQLIALERRMALVIAGDSGPLHLAAALRVPVLALFGPTDPQRNGPWDTLSRVLRDASSVTDHHRAQQVDAGLARITVQQVLDAALTLLQEESPQQDDVPLRG